MPGRSDVVVGYVVSTWPRLSQTFVLNEVLAVENAGVPVQIFSAKDPGGEPVHADVASVRAPVRYLTLRSNGFAVAAGNLRIAIHKPISYFAVLGQAARHGRMGVLRRFFQAAYLANLLRDEPITHLHAHFATAPALISMYTSALTGIPYTFTAHARDIFVDTTSGILREEMANARAVVTISEYNIRHLQTIEPAVKGKIHCIYNGLNLEQFPDLGGGETQQTPLILGVGRLIEKKGFGELISAAALLRERGTRFAMEIIGAGELREELERQAAALGVGELVRFSGAQPQEAVRAAYARAAVFALPCVVAGDGDRDGIPTVLIEAMASGVAVVSTPVSGVPELIEDGHSGLLVPSGAAGELANALDRLLRDKPLRRRLAANARGTIEERFDIARNSRDLIRLFAGREGT